MSIKYILLSLVMVLTLAACDSGADFNSAAKNLVDDTPQTVEPLKVSAQNTLDTVKSAVQKTAETNQGEVAKSFVKTVAKQSKYQEGVHYQRLAQEVPVADASKLEVVEVFWYGCIHCYHFEPIIKGWKKSMPSDVAFVGVPAVWNERLSLHARAYYTAKQLNILDKMHDPLFKAMNVDKKPLASQSEIKAVFTANGVDGDEFDAMFNSFGVTSMLSMAESKAKSYGIEGTPEVVVNGKYRISAKMAGGQQQMIGVIDYLLSKERK